MLTLFSVKNFRGFDKEVVINLANARDYLFNEDCVRDGVVHKAMIYGYNSVGKTNFGRAMHDIVKTLTNKWADAESYKNYLNVNDPEGLAEFRYEFRFDNTDVVYKYGKKSWVELVYEELTINNQIVAKYDKRDTDPILLSLSGTENLQIDKSSLEISIVRFIASNTIRPVGDQQSNAFTSMIAFADQMLMFWSLDTRGFIGNIENGNNNIFNTICDPLFWDDYRKLMLENALGDLTYRDENGNKTVYVRFRGGRELNFWESCSAGTKAVSLFYYWYVTTQKKKSPVPSLLFIDEFSAFYHTALANKIVKLVKTIDSQVIMTTHNTALMTNELFRPDCLYLLYHDSVNSIADLSGDREVREGNNLEKMYRSGLFDD